MSTIANERENNFEIIVKTLYGLENVLAKELSEIGAININVYNRAVSFPGNNYLLYKSNLNLRTALRILKPVKKFDASNERELYKGIFSINWGKYLDNSRTFVVDSVVSSDFFKHSKYVSLKVKDAIVDQFREKTGSRPSIDTVNPTLRINMHIAQKKCTVSLDSSGESLHKRGYINSRDETPLNEVLAAGIILLTEWDGKGCFIDPMCGSGTLIIEAALIANRIAPGIIRKKFGFMSWKDFHSDLYKKIYKDCLEKSTGNNNFFGADISDNAIRIAKENIAKATLGNKIKLFVNPFEKLPKFCEKGIIITNPPYGERKKQEDIFGLYKSIGDTLKHNFAGFEAWILSSNMEALKKIELRVSRKHTLFNGPLECKLHQYNIYEGSKKIKK